MSNHQGRGIKAVLHDRIFLSPYLNDHDANGEYVVGMKHFTKSYHKKYLLMEVFSINNLKGFLTDSLGPMLCLGTYQIYKTNFSQADGPETLT